VQTSITEKDVLNLLAEKKLTKVISLSSERYNPFDRKNPFSQEILYAPVQPHYLNYQKKLDKYFFDQSGNFQLYYVKNENQIEKKIASALKNYQEKYFLEIYVNSRTLEKILFVFFFVLFVLHSRLKLFFALSFSPLCTAFFIFPSYMLGVASLFFASALSIFFQYIEKDNYADSIKKDKFIILFFFFAIFCVFAEGLQTFLIFLACVSVSFLGIIFYKLVQKQFQKRKNFVPLTITGIQTIHLTQKFYQQYTLLCLIFIIFFSLSFTFNNSASSNSKSISQISIPKPTNIANKINFADFENLYTSSQESMINQILLISTYWDAAAFPFISMHQNQERTQFGNKLFYTVYKKQEDKSILKTEIDAIKFDTDFIEKLKKKIVSGSASIEKMIMQKNNFFTVSYSEIQRKTKILAISNIHFYDFLLSLAFSLIAFLINTIPITKRFLSLRK
ncbi:MAG: hypothetical protein ACRC4W_03155, partial [Treponemataceae bacterium]